MLQNEIIVCNRGRHHCTVHEIYSVCVSLYIQLASDAGALVSMTESEKKRLEELMSDNTELEVRKWICVYAYLCVHTP